MELSVTSKEIQMPVASHNGVMQRPNLGSGCSSWSRLLCWDLPGRDHATFSSCVKVSVGLAGFGFLLRWLSGSSILRFVIIRGLVWWGWASKVTISGKDVLGFPAFPRFDSNIRARLARGLPGLGMSWTLRAEWKGWKKLWSLPRTPWRDRPLSALHPGVFFAASWKWFLWNRTAWWRAGSVSHFNFLSKYNLFYWFCSILKS